MPHSSGAKPGLDASGAAGRIAAVEHELQTFSYIVSHDLAASFRHVSEFSRLLVGELADDLTDRQRAQADHIRDATDKCQMMMEQLLLFSRVQQQPVLPVRQDASSAMRMVLTQLGAGEVAGLKVDVEPLGDVWGDAKLLSLVFRHLLDNAIKFSRANSPVRIRVRPAHDEAYWRIRITDNGIGIAASQRERAFEMFQHLNAASAYPGVGAGLAICRRIARLHGGDLAFLDCDTGACIELALPHGPSVN